MFDIDSILLTKAKTELAFRAMYPFAPNPIPSLQKLHEQMTLIRTEHAASQYRFFDGGGDFKELGSDVIVSQLFLQASHITQKHAERPNVLTMPKEHLTAWFYSWELRLGIWSATEQFFATARGWRDCNKFLDVWHELTVERAIPDGRGCERWLKQHLLIPADASTRYDQTLHRTVVATPDV